MKFSPVKFSTKSNKEITVREALASDAEQVIACIKSYLATGYIPLTLEEFNPTIEEQSKWIEKFLNGAHDLLLVAEYENIIIGNIDLTINPRQMLKHTGYIGGRSSAVAGSRHWFCINEKSPGMVCSTTGN